MNAMGLVDAKRVQRLYDRVVANAKNCSYEDLEALLLAAGFTVRNASGSHRIFKRGTQYLSVPERRPVKLHYVKEALQMVDELL